MLYAHAITSLGQEEWLAHQFKPRLELSSLGVEIFFIISGYLVTHSLLQSKNRKTFAFKRLLRLWPALFVVTVVLGFVIGPILTNLRLQDYFTHQDTWIFLIRNSVFWPVFHLPGVLNSVALNSTFWTLLFEAMSYAILFVIGKSILLRYKNLFIIGWILFLMYKYFIPHTIVWPPSLKAYEYGISSMVFFFCTSACWYLFSAAKKIPSNILQWMSVVVFVLYTTIPALPDSFDLVRDIALVLLITEWGKSKAIIKWPSWDISYGTYLIAFTVQLLLVHLAKDWLSTAPAICLATICITIPLAFVLWYAVEKPALQLKEKLLQ